MWAMRSLAAAPRQVRYFSGVIQRRREQKAAVGMLLRHFRDVDVANGSQSLSPEVVGELKALGFYKQGDAAEARYDFKTVRRVLAFLEHRSDTMFLVNLISLSSTVAVLLITLYFNADAKSREESKLAAERLAEEQRAKEVENRERWEALFDVRVASSLDGAGVDQRQPWSSSHLSAENQNVAHVRDAIHALARGSGTPDGGGVTVVCSYSFRPLPPPSPSQSLRIVSKVYANTGVFLFFFTLSSYSGPARHGQVNGV
jgi:hypothetical protein